jgi:hypothetical protein
VEAHVWATWHHIIGPQNAMCLNRIGPPHMPNNLPHHPLPHHHFPHVSMFTLPHVCTVCTVSSTDCTINKKFTCLEKWTERDISRIQRLLEPIQVALGS